MEEEKVCCVCLQKSKRLDVTCLKCFRSITEDFYWRLLPTEDEDEYPPSLCNRHRADRNPKYEKVNKHLEEWITCLQCNNNAHKVFVYHSSTTTTTTVATSGYIVHFLLTTSNNISSPIQYCTTGSNIEDFCCPSCPQPSHHLTSAYLLDKLDDTHVSNHINRRLQSTDASASIGEYGTTFTVKEIYQGTDQCAMISVLQRLYPVRHVG